MEVARSLSSLGCSPRCLWTRCWGYSGRRYLPSVQAWRMGQHPTHHSGYRGSNCVRLSAPLPDRAFLSGNRGGVESPPAHSLLCTELQPSASFSKYSATPRVCGVRFDSVPESAAMLCVAFSPTPEPGRLTEVFIARLEVVLRRDHGRMAEPGCRVVIGKLARPIGGARSAHVLEQPGQGVSPARAMILCMVVRRFDGPRSVGNSWGSASSKVKHDNLPF